MLVILVGCGTAPPAAPADVPASAPIRPPAPDSRTHLRLSELEDTGRCTWRQLPMPLHFHCGSAELDDLEVLSAEGWRDALALIDADATILGVQTFGFFSSRLEPEREDLAAQRARTVAFALAGRFGLASAAHPMGHSPDATQCTCAIRCERYAQVAVLYCDP